MAVNYAAMSPTITVRLTDGTEYRVVTGFGDVMGWEKYARAHDLDFDMSFTMLGFYAWRGARQQGICPQDVGLDEFVGRFDGFPVPELGDEPDPTRPALGDG